MLLLNVLVEPFHFLVAATLNLQVETVGILRVLLLELIGRSLVGRVVAMTLAPAFRKASETAFPIPLVPPVTITV